MQSLKFNMSLESFKNIIPEKDYKHLDIKEIKENGRNFIIIKALDDYGKDYLNNFKDKSYKY